MQSASTVKPGSLAASRDRPLSSSGFVKAGNMQVEPKLRGDFTTPDKALKSIPDLQQLLKDSGFPAKLELASSNPKDVCGVINGIAKVLTVLECQKAAVVTSQSELKAVRAEIQAKDKELETRSNQISALELKCGNLQIEATKLGAQLKQETSAQFMKMRESDKSLIDLDRRVKHYQHEIRRKEVEIEDLRDRLRRYLAERTRDQNFMNQAHSHVISMLDQPGRAGKMLAADEDMYKAAIKLYVEQQEKLEQEKEDIREALHQLEREHTLVSNELLRAKTTVVDDSLLARQHGWTEQESGLNKVQLIERLRTLQTKCAEYQASSEKAQVKSAEHLRNQELAAQARQEELQRMAEELKATHEEQQAALQAVNRELQDKMIEMQQEQDRLRDSLQELRAAVRAVGKGTTCDGEDALEEGTDESLSRLQGIQAELESLQQAYAAAVEQVRKLRAEALSGWGDRAGVAQKGAAGATLPPGAPRGSGGTQASQFAGTQTLGGSRAGAPGQAFETALRGSHWFVGSQAAAAMAEDELPLADDVKQANAAYIEELLQLQGELDDGAKALLQEGNPAVVAEVLRKLNLTQELSDGFMALDDKSSLEAGAAAMSRAAMSSKIRELEEGLAAAKDVVAAQRAALLVTLFALETGRAQHEAALREQEARDSLSAEQAAEAEKANALLSDEIAQLTRSVKDLNEEMTQQAEAGHAVKIELDRQLEDAKQAADKQAAELTRLVASLESRLKVADAQLAATKKELDIVESENDALRRELEEAVKEIESSDRQYEAWNDELTKQRLLQESDMIESERRKVAQSAEQRKLMLLDAWKDVRVTGDAVIHKEREVRKTQEALISTVEKWAPGFGAGKFLGRHVVNETAALASELIAADDGQSAPLPDVDALGGTMDEAPTTELAASSATRVSGKVLPQVKVKQLRTQIEKVNESLAVDFSPVKGTTDMKDHLEEAFEDISRERTEVKTNADERKSVTRKISERFRSALSQSATRREARVSANTNAAAPELVLGELAPVEEIPDTPSNFMPCPEAAGPFARADRS